MSRYRDKSVSTFVLARAWKASEWERCVNNIIYDINDIIIWANINATSRDRDHTECKRIPLTTQERRKTTMHK